MGKEGAPSIPELMVAKTKKRLCEELGIPDPPTIPSPTPSEQRSTSETQTMRGTRPDDGAPQEGILEALVTQRSPGLR